MNIVQRGNMSNRQEDDTTVLGETGQPHPRLTAKLTVTG